MWVFQGHQILALLADVGLAIVWIFILEKIIRYRTEISNKFTGWYILIGYYMVMMIPNSAYAMFELRHLIFIDNVADIPNIWSYIVFGGVSLIGFLSAIYGNRMIIDHLFKDSGGRNFGNLFLSLAQGFGGVAGLLDFYSIVGFIYPPILIQVAGAVFSSPPLIALALGAALLFFLTNFLIDRFSWPST